MKKKLNYIFHSILELLILSLANLKEFIKSKEILHLHKDSNFKNISIYVKKIIISKNILLHKNLY